MLQALSRYKREICTEDCGPGQKCRGDDCVPCEEGTFQSAEVHRNKSCYRWTKKSRNDHWVLAQNGNATQDKVYECEEGFHKKEYTPGSWECRLNEVTSTSTTSTPISSAFPTNYTTSSTVATPRPSTEESDNILPYILALLVLIIMIGVVILLICLYKKKKCCFKNNIVLSRTSTQSNSSELSEVISESTNPLINHSNPATPVHRQFEIFIYHLPTQKLETFFQLLGDPSKMFYFQVSMNKYRNLESFEQYRLTFLDWMVVNKVVPQYKECVQQALNKMGSDSLYQTFLKELQSPLGAAVNNSGH